MYAVLVLVEPILADIEDRGFDCGEFPGVSTRRVIETVKFKINNLQLTSPPFVSCTSPCYILFLEHSSRDSLSAV